MKKHTKKNSKHKTRHRKTKENEGFFASLFGTTKKRGRKAH